MNHFSILRILPLPFFLLLLFTNHTFLNAKKQDSLVVGYHVTPPFVIEGKTRLEGPSVWLWENIAKENDFNYRYKKYTLDSLLTAFKNKEIDLSLSPITITSTRSEFIDFTSPYYIAHASILKQNESVISKAFKFIGSFFTINFIRALTALVFVIFVFGMLIWLFERKKNKEEFSPGIKGIWEGFWWSAVTMTTVGYGDKSPRSTGGRIVGLVWMFTAIIIISGFTAGIASALTVNRLDDASNSIDDFKNKKLGTIEGSDTSLWLRDNFFKNKIEYHTLNEMLTALKMSEIDAIAYDQPLLHTIMKNDSLSEYMLLDLKYNPQFYAIGINQEMADSIQEKINLSMLSETEKLDWQVLLSEYDLD